MYQVCESLAAHLTSDAEVVTESGLDMWSVEYNIESFQTVRKTIGLQNHKVIVLGNSRASSFGLIPGR